jgi:hypothetical protein
MTISKFVRVQIILGITICTVTGGVCDAALAQDVKTAVQTSLGQEAADDWARPSVWLSTAALDRALGDSFASTQVGLSIVLPHQDVPAPPSAPVMTDKCEDRSCSSTRGCNSNCTDDCTHDVKVFGAKVGTALDPFCYANCEAGKVLCEAAKKAEHDLCEVNKALYLGFCGKKLGTVTLSDVSADAIVGLTNLRLTTDLASRRANLAGDISGKATVQGHLHFAPEPVTAALTLCAVFDGWVPPQAATIHTEGFSFDAALEIAKPDPQSSRFQINLGLNPIDVKLTVSGNPMLDIIGNNPLNFFSCPGLSLVGATVDLFKRDYDFESRVSLPQPPPIVLGTVDLDPSTLPGLEPGGTGISSLSFRRPQ